MNKLAVIVLALAACEHAEPTTKQAPPPPPPPKPDPVHQAHDEFELLAPDYAVGTSQLYSRSAFLAGPDLTADHDDGDFIGRLRTLFGPRGDDDYVLRDKQTGLIVTAYSGDSGPAYGGGPRYPDPLPPAGDTKALATTTTELADREARLKADPVLHGDTPPTDDVPHYRLYARHLGDAMAGPERGAVIARLDALVSQVPPADFSELKFYEETSTVYKIGAKSGHSFAEEAPAAEGMALLLARPSSIDNDVAVLDFYIAHQADLAADKPKVKAVLADLAALAKKTTGTMRQLLDQHVKDFTEALR